MTLIIILLTIHVIIPIIASLITMITSHIAIGISDTGTLLITNIAFHITTCASHTSLITVLVSHITILSSLIRMPLLLISVIESHITSLASLIGMLASYTYH